MGLTHSTALTGIHKQGPVGSESDNPAGRDTDLLDPRWAPQL